MRRFAAGIARLSAAAVLAGALVVLPLAVWLRVGGPGGVDWAAAFTDGRIQPETVVASGLVVFSALWAWFAATAVSEVVRIAAWRVRPTVTLAPVDPTPSGAIRRLVRIALVSTSTVVGAGVASMASAFGPGTAATVHPAPVVSVAELAAGTGDGWMAADAHPAAGSASVGRLGSGVPERAGVTVGDRAEVASNGRDTPYSVAVRLGDPSLRDRIIELNHGATTPDGGSWAGGVFPAGMTVRVPEGVLVPRDTTWREYSVVAGDSVYRIATRLAEGDNRRVRQLADSIIDRNLGRTMVDGKVFDDPSLVRIGWVLEVPASPALPPSSTPAVSLGSAHHVVEPGESYWSIASDHTVPPARPSTVADLVGDLRQLNAERLGHDDPDMLHPGDRLVLPAGHHPAGHRPAAEPVPVDAPVGPDVVIDLDAAAPIATGTDIPPTDVPTPAVAPTIAPTIAPTPPSAQSVPGAASPSEPAPVPATSPAHVEAGPSEPRSPMTTSLAAAVLLCAGALGLVESRRRQQLRRTGPLTELPVPSDELVRTERLVRSLDATQRAVRLDVALRSAGHLLVGTGGYVRAAIVGDDSSVTLLLDRPGRAAAAPWRPDERNDRWVLDASVPNDDVAPTARLAGQPCPAMIHLGRLALDDGAPATGELFLDLEAFGLVCLDAGDDVQGTARVPGTPSATDAIVRAVATSLAASPMAETLRLVTHGLDPAVHLGNLNAEAADDLEHALDLAAAALGSTPTAIGGLRTSELRARGVGGEAWEPVVVVSTGATLSRTAVRELLDLTRAGGRSLAVVLGHAVEGASLVVRATATGWELAPLGLTVVPVGVAHDHVRQLSRLLEAADAPLPDAPGVDAARARRGASRSAPAADDTPGWALMIKVLGGVEVVTAAGDVVGFDRGKSLELVAWLGQHRQTATRGAARAALWELAVRDATFSNVVSDARRSLARAVPPAEGVDWIGRTTTSQLPLHDLVVTDADLLRRRLDRARTLPSAEAVAVLQPGVALIRDLPFAGTDYLWPSAEGITSALTLLATSAATELARHHLALGDVDGVFWATGQGLLALPGHEELIGLRMRAHAQRGDLAGVRGEWEGYERAITADAWSDGEPSPKLLALRRELLNR